MSIIVITHNDLDACGTVVLLKCVYGSSRIKTIKFCNYDNVDKEINKSLNNEIKKETDKLNIPHLFITDICPSDTILQKIHNIPYFMVNLFDHHKTKEKILSKYKWATFDRRYSATLLVYKWLKDTGKIKLNSFIDNAGLAFANACNDYDMWNLQGKSRKRGENLNSLLWFIGHDAFINIFYNNLEADLENPLYKELLYYLERNKKAYVDKVIKEQLRKTEYCMDGFGKTFKIIIADEFISDVGQAALADEESEDLHYIVIVNPMNNTVSLRSRQNEDIDVAERAQLLNGGGHKSASGFQLNMTKNIKNKVFKMLNGING